MGAEITYIVKVLRVVECYVETDAVTSDQAMAQAANTGSIVKALQAWPKGEEPEEANL